MKDKNDKKRTGINPNAARYLANNRKKKVDAATYIAGILAKNRVLLGQAITLIESNRPNHQEIAQQIIEACLPYSGNSIRIGITGSPGVGKSTFIETFGNYLIAKGKKTAVLAIDPSSQVSKGSILGDKTRMESLSSNGNAFIRPSPAGDSLGGVARKTRETIVLCEAAGYDIILIETVGVGQSEIAVHSMVDFFLLLLLPGAGDELQGIKRGIVEMADLIAINKADGDRETLAKQAKSAYRNSLHLFPSKESTWNPPVVLCSGLNNIGIDGIWQEVQNYLRITSANQFFDQQRREQSWYWLKESIDGSLRQQFFTHPAVKAELSVIKEKVLNGKLSSFKGADELMKLFSRETDG